jgi:nitrogen fixation protein NifB
MLTTLLSLAEQIPALDDDRTHSPETVFHLPVCPQMVARTRFSPPAPVSNRCLTVSEAMELLRLHREKRKGRVTMVALTGPGDPLSTPDITFSVIREIKKRYPTMSIGLKTMGINSRKLAPELARSGVDYIELIVDAVRADILAKLYAWIRPGQKTLKITEAAVLLLGEQRSGILSLKFHGISVSILSTLYPGYNIDHLPLVSEEMMELGIDSIALQPYIPEPGTEVELQSPSGEILASTAEKVSKHLPVTEPLLAVRQGGLEKAENDARSIPKATPQRPNVAVVSSNGIEIDLHLGQAGTFLIYGPRDDGLPCLLESRQAPASGSGAKRWAAVAEVLRDCFALLTASAGEAPRKGLDEAGIRVLTMQDNIEGVVDALYGGTKKGKGKSK